MAKTVTQTLGIVDTDTSKIVGATPQGVSDPTYWPSSTNENVASLVATGFTQQQASNPDIKAPAGVGNGVIFDANALPIFPVSSIAKIAGVSFRKTGNGSYIADNYARTKAALKRVREKTGNMIVLCAGSSVTAGAYALNTSTPTGLTDVKKQSWPTYMAYALNSNDYPAYDASFIGDQNCFAISAIQASAYDPRITLGSGWASNASTFTAGGATIWNNSNTNSLTFLPYQPVDTFKYFYATNTGLAQFTMSRTGDTTSPVIDSSAAAGVGSYTFTGALGNTNPISVQRNGTGSGLYTIGMIAWNSTIPCINVVNVGWSGGKLSDFAGASTAFASLNALKALGGDTLVLEVGVNDWYNSTGASAFQTLLDSTVASLLPVIDVILKTSYPSQSTAGYTLPVQKQYIDAIYAVAGKYGLLVQDSWQKIGSYEAANGMGLYFNALHPNSGIYRPDGEATAQLLLSLA